MGWEIINLKLAKIQNQNINKEYRFLPIMEKLSVNILVREEKMNDKKVFIVNNEDTGVADFGDTLDEAIENFKKSLRLYLETYPNKRELFIDGAQEPILISRILI